MIRLFKFTCLIFLIFSLNLKAENITVFDFTNDELKTLKVRKVKGKTNKTVTLINFLPSKEVFSNTKFNSSTLQKRMRELAFLNKGLSINLVDKSENKEKEYKNKYEGGIQEFVDFLQLL